MKRCLKNPAAVLAAAAVIALSGIVIPHAAEAATEQKLAAEGLAAGDKFGNAVAIDGDTAIVGAQGTANSMGAAYIFTRSGGTWSQQAKLTAGDGKANDYFGMAVDISGDTIAVGAYGHNSQTGAVYIFIRSGTTWSQQAKLSAGDAFLGDNFGGSVAIDGDTFIAGAATKDGNTGAAYVFTRSGSAWSQQAKLSAVDGAAEDRFGNSVAISGDSAIVGAYTRSSNTGAAYIFTRSGGTWSQQAKLSGSDSAASDHFGINVLISGTSAFVAAQDNDTGTGAVYFFTQSGGAWSQQAKIKASNSAKNTFFGRSIALDGDTLVVSRGFGKGVAYVFTRGAGTWSQRAALEGSDAVVSDWYGMSVAVSGGTALVGAYARDNGTGAVYVYDSLLPPAVTSAPVSALGPQTATLAASLVSMGSAATVNVSFEYGIDDYDHTTPPQVMTATGAFSAVVSGLTPGKTYYFRAKADGGGAGIAYSQGTTFTTTQGTTTATTTGTTTATSSTTGTTSATSTPTTGVTTSTTTSTTGGGTTTPGTTATPTPGTPQPPDASGIPWWLIIGAAVGLIGGVIYYVYRRSKT